MYVNKVHFFVKLLYACSGIHEKDDHAAAPDS